VFFGANFMSRLSPLAVLLSFMLAPMTAISADPLKSVYAPTPGTPKPNGTYGIEALLSMPKNSYKIGEPITVTFALKNLRNAKQILRCRHAPYGNGLIILDATGRQITSTGLKNIGPLTVLDGGPNRYTVEPGAVLDCATNVSILYWGYQLGPGSYSVRATWAETDLPYHEPIVSNAVDFSVSQ
jgi:hypothetical protein